jgi:hypothetical protein
MPLDPERQIYIHDAPEDFGPAILSMPKKPADQIIVDNHEIGSLDELIHLRHHFSNALPAIARLVQARNSLVYLSYWNGAAFGDQVSADIEQLTTLIRELHAPLLEQDWTKISDS